MLPLIFMLTPAWAEFKGPSVSEFAPVTQVLAATQAPEGATCVLTGNIIQHEGKDRYTFKDASGSMEVRIAPPVFGALEVTPQNTVRLTGEIAGKRSQFRLEPHLRVRYLEKVQ